MTHIAGLQSTREMNPIAERCCVDEGPHLGLQISLSSENKVGPPPIVLERLPGPKQQQWILLGVESAGEEADRSAGINPELPSQPPSQGQSGRLREYVELAGVNVGWQESDSIGEFRVSLPQPRNPDRAGRSNVIDVGQDVLLQG